MANTCGKESQSRRLVTEGTVGRAVVLGPPPFGGGLDVVPRDRLCLPTPHLHDLFDGLAGHRLAEGTAHSEGVHGEEGR